MIILCTSDTRSLDHATQISVVILSMTQTVRTLAQQRDVASAALDAGGRRKTATSFEWDVAGKCEKPVPVELVGRPSAPLIVVGRNIANAKTVVVSPSKPVPLFIDLQVPCRKCGPCLKNRANYWRTRAASEIKISARTWFVTLTLRPDRTFYYLELMRHNALARGIDADREDSNSRFRRHCQEIGRELTMFLKRVRKNSRAKLRYCAVFEPHKSGDPHIHVLIHEVIGNNPVTKRVIQDAWHDGFSTCKLVNLGDEMKSAAYATKYITKDASTRIRASQRYGEGGISPSALLRETVEFNRRIEIRRNVSGHTSSGHNPETCSSKDVK